MIKLERVCKEYRRGTVVIRALDEATINIGDGEFCAVMGPSGSGKSTLLNVIAGLDTISSGEIFLDGQPVRGSSDAEWTRRRREWMGMVFQSFHLVPGLTASENVGLPLQFNGQSSTFIRQRVKEVLEMVGLGHRQNHRPSELSGGEQQRVAIARAVVHRPRVLLADEPTGNLDSHQGAEIVELLHRIAKAAGQTVILVTHSEAAARVGDTLYALQDGQLKPKSLPQLATIGGSRMESS
ncbi:ABC transporter ATP-binding protein [Candidatus Nitronereus thalassa]|uniref:ABC transporter ATP-binding protein n=1 Tax=Candidatus Nitronereus thalassa TaxID=3020898 RepID=A0ABU3KAX9_9BACT|nr:ABC transporter ATP-binding protein [Candidatus Nitronereus thalassa]MDT7043463.1 ABC transporter ATP-binding protein [Candidatus Nitronereus thalassa]